MGEKRLTKLGYILCLCWASPFSMNLPTKRLRFFFNTEIQRHTFAIIASCVLLSSLSADPWGKDADLCQPRTTVTPSTSTPLQKVGEVLIRFHQEVISPIDGPRSHYRPSSSGYALEAIKQYGFFSGIVVGCDRLLRENADPWVYPTVLFDKARLKWDPVDGSRPSCVIPFDEL